MISSTTESPLATDQLVAFQRIAREGSFSRAAFSLDIGQPAVSSRIRALEQAIGGALFTRGRRIALTALGETFLPYVERALAVLDEGMDKGRLAGTGKRGRVTLAALGSLSGGLVGPALAELMRSHSDVEWMIRSGNHESVLQALWDGLVELGLVVWPCTEALAPNLTPLVLLHEPVVAVCHPKHELAERRVVTRDDLVRLAQPLYRLRWWRHHHPEIASLTERSGAVVDVPMESARHLLGQRIGAGFFVRTYVADDLAEGRLVQLAVRDQAPLYRDSALVRRTRPVPLSPAATLFVDAIRAQAHRLGLLAPPRSPRSRRNGGSRRGRF
jgi:DNA-binding transcriptional LysR family regulator